MTAVTLTLDVLDEARRDPVVFADKLIGQPLWPHQVEVVRSTARYRCLCAGRRSGKTRVFGVLSLHLAYAVPGSKVLIVSASDTSAKRMFADILGMVTGSPYLSVSIGDDTTHLLTLSNGSTIESVPSSMKAVRAAEADLLIVDEAGFVDQSIWEAAEPVVGARKGARVLIASTPWGSPDHFFRSLWSQGMRTPDTEVQSWHWPSDINPNVDRVWLAGVKSRSSDDYFAREYLAEWTDETGSYFTEAEIMSCVADYRMTSPEEILHWLDRPYKAAAGIDWGMAKDANAVVLVAALEDHSLNMARLGPEDLVFYIPWMEARHGWAYSDFIERVVNIGKRYHLRVVASETNGVGAYPTTMLRQRMHEAGNDSHVLPIVTDVRRKQSGFGMIKGLLQQRRLVLPREPELLKQLHSLHFEQLPSGATRIAVPDNLGHDDIAMALMQAISCVIVDRAKRWVPRGWSWEPDLWVGDTVTTKDHLTDAPILTVPEKPLPVADHYESFWSPAGGESSDPW